MRFTFVPLTRARRLAPLLAFLPVLVGAPAYAAQLQFRVGEETAVFDGRTTMLSRPQIVSGRTLLPMTETAHLYGYRLNREGDVVSVLGTGLSVGAVSGEVYLDGRRQFGDDAVVIDGRLYVSARTLAAALGGRLNTGLGGLLVLDAPPAGAPVQATPAAKPPVPAMPAVRQNTPPRVTLAPASPNLPAQLAPPEMAPPEKMPPFARFATDKREYAIGERIIYTDYSYDPDGSAIVAHKWTGRKEAFFAAGTYQVGLTVTDGQGQSSAAYTQSVRVTGPVKHTPLSYGLSYGAVGDTFADSRVLTYPVLDMRESAAPNAELLFSDSPEKPQQSGVLLQSRLVAGAPARLLGYHINAAAAPARLYVMARNVGSRSARISLGAGGSAAPSRYEGLLGQVTLMEYFATQGQPARTLTLGPGQAAPVFVSPTLQSGSGASVLQDIQATEELEISFVMLDAGVPMSNYILRGLPYLPLDDRHQRGAFAGANRPMIAALPSNLPARVVIGDGTHDPVLTGRDTVTGAPQRLLGNYGVLYDMTFTGAAGTAIALSPRGGLYRGAMHITDGDLTQVIKLPREGNATRADEPTLLWRAQSDTVRVQFMPANGSALPVNLVFYRLPESAAYKWYQP